MEIINFIRFVLGILCLLTGVLIFFIELIGVFRFQYVLNRMHAAAIGDTFGIGISLVGLMFLSGFNFNTLKIALIIVFFWLASPVSSHLISRLEVTTNEELEKECELPEATKQFEIDEVKSYKTTMEKEKEESAC